MATQVIQNIQVGDTTYEIHDIDHDKMLTTANLDSTYLNRTTSSSQTVAGPVEMQANITADKTIYINLSDYNTVRFTNGGGFTMAGWNWGINAFYIGSVSANVDAAVGSQGSATITIPNVIANNASNYSTSGWYIAIGLTCSSGYVNTISVGSGPITKSGNTLSYEVWLNRVKAASNGTGTFNINFIIFHIK